MAPRRDEDRTDLSDVTLSTDRLVLRPWRPDDADTVAEIMADGSWRPYLDVPAEYTAADAREFVREIAPTARTNGTELTCAVVTGADLVGAAGLAWSEPDRNAAHIGYWIAPARQRNGYAVEASRALADWGFAHGVHRIEITCDLANTASALVAMGAGFAFEAVRRGDYPFRGLHRDSAVFARLAGDDARPVPRAYPPLPGGALSDGAVALRVSLPEDADAFVEQDADPLTLAMGFSGTAPPRPAVEAMLARTALHHLVGPDAGFTVVDVASGRFAGAVRLRRAGPPGIGGVGYAVHPAFRGRGYTTRALRLLAEWAFEQAGLARLELGARIDNVASQRAALSAGFEPDGIWRSRLRTPDGDYRDEARFALINPRYAGPAPRNA